jgi:hypothetical protein
MKRLIIILGIITLCNGAFAIERDKAAHFGVSYALQTGMYGLSKKAFRLKRDEALIFSIVTSLLVTTAVEYMPGNQFDTKDILANGLGIGAASATILMFDF